MRRFGKGGVPILLGYKTRSLGESKFLASAEEYFDISIERLGTERTKLDLGGMPTQRIRFIRIHTSSNRAFVLPAMNDNPNDYVNL